MSITNGLLCDVYLNLHKTGFLSVRAAEGPDKGRVVGHVSAIQLEDCSFRVSEAGRQRVIRDRCKNVHATVRAFAVAAGRDAFQRCVDGRKVGDFVFAQSELDVALSVDLRAGVLGVTKMLRSHIRTAHGAATLRCQLCQHLGTQCEQLLLERAGLFGIHGFCVVCRGCLHLAPCAAFRG